eukprot:364841-Chlamydomonas_euryale.AAC.12
MPDSSLAKQRRSGLAAGQRKGGASEALQLGVAARDGSQGWQPGVAARCDSNMFAAMCGGKVLQQGMA